MGKVIGLTFDLKKDYPLKEGDPPDADAEFDAESTIEVIVEAIENYGHKVIKIGNVSNLLERLDDLRVDLVFNISEGLFGRNREAQVPTILEMMGIPFVGADALTLSLTLDKLMTKKILVFEGIPTPRFFEAKTADDLEALDHFRFPLIVKPRYEGSSKGLTEESRVEEKSSLKRRIEYIINTYEQPALIEEFISGSEFTVAIIGNDPAMVFPPVQIKIDGDLNLGNRFYTFEHISSGRLEYICPPQISKSLEEELKRLALKTYRAVECRDFGRVDFRVDEGGRPYVLEINPLPSLSTEDVFMVIARQEGVSYSQIINRILNAAIKRYGMDRKWRLP